MMNKPSFIESLQAGISNLNSQDVLEDPQLQKELDEHWSGLQYLGIELDFTENALLCNHHENGFSFSIPYSQADSDDLRRSLFTELRGCFGNFSDRHLSSLFQPSNQVTTLFASFRTLLQLCTNIARQQTAA